MVRAAAPSVNHRGARYAMTGQDSEFRLLMEGVVAGSDAAAAKLLERYGPAVLQAVRRRLNRHLRSKFDSLDFVQDVWASFFANPPSQHRLHRPEMLVAFLAQVARNKVINVTRQRLQGTKRNVNREHSLDNSTVGGPAAVPAKQATPSEVGPTHRLSPYLDPAARRQEDHRNRRRAANESPHRPPDDRQALTQVKLMKSAPEPDVLADLAPESAWRCGPAAAEATDVPSWLATLVDLAGDPEAPASGATGKSGLLHRAYQDYCSRRAAGERLDPDAFCAQFPHLQSSLTRLIRAHRFLEDNPHLLGEKPPADWPEPGQTFLGFELQEELGRGAFARVFLATEPALGNRQVAVKISEGGGAEANTLGRINHPNIVAVYSVQEEVETGLTAVCMPYHGSTTLCNLLDKVQANTTLPRSAQAVAPADGAAGPVRLGSYVDAIGAIGAQLAEALQFIHERDICHRDLKPSNVLMTPDGKPMLLDFNLCADPQVVDTRVGGTLPYMPPEQLRATGPDQMAETAGLDARSDLFSLGVMLYELLTGQHPFGPLPLQLTPEETWQLLLARQQTGARPIRQLNPEVDTDLARLVERCLAYDPAARPQRAAELASALQRRQSRLQRARRWVGRHAWSTAAAVVLFLGITAAALTFWPQPEPEFARHWRLGKEADTAGKFQTAIDHFDKADALEPGRVDLLKARGRSYQRLAESSGDESKFNQAASDYFKVLEAQPKDGATHASRGYCLLRLRISSARGDLEKAVENGIDSAANFNNLAYYWLSYGADNDKAIANLTEAIKRKDDLQAAYFNRAVARLHIVETAGGSKNPLKKGGPITQKVKDSAARNVQHLVSAKEDIRKAVEFGKDAAPTELLLHAALIWAISSDYDANDLPAALGYLKVALAKGLDPEAVKHVNLPSILRDNPDLQKIVDDAVNARKQPGFVAPRAIPQVQRIMDPDRD